MTPRVRILMFGLLGAVLVWQMWPTVHGALFGPLDALRERIARLDDDLEKKTKIQRDNMRALKKLKDWTSRALPADRHSAATLYQNWLIDLAQQHKLSNVKVSPTVDARPKGNTYYTVTATLMAEGTLPQLRDFLYEFQKSGLLHKVKSMNLESTRHQGDPVLKAVIGIEGLALVRGAPRTTLLAKDLAAPPIMSKVEYDGLTSKNLFVRGYNGPPPPKEAPKPPMAVPTPTPMPKPPVEDPFDSREFVVLAGLLLGDDGSKEAWLYDQSSNVRTDLAEGKGFKVAGLEGTVLSIDELHVTLQIKKEDFQLELGRNLKELRKLASASPAPVPPASVPPASTPTVPGTSPMSTANPMSEGKPMSDAKPAKSEPKATDPAAKTPETAKPEAGKAESEKADAPKTDLPKTDLPKTDIPKIDGAKPPASPPGEPKPPGKAVN